ncbi:lamin tail domain-containing protein [Luteolibacter pohnpeiensis]|nr:lamin tail domain-containing protein [Luteolibacter pohnpeiensis]
MNLYRTALRHFPAVAPMALLLFGYSESIADPVAWFKADSIQSEAESAVSQWIDSSQNGHLAQAVGAAPTLDLQGMNGLPSVHFDGSQSMSFSRPIDGDFTILVLFKSSAGSGSSSNFYSGAGLVSAETPGVTDDFGIALSESGRVIAGTGSPDVTIRSPQGFDDGAPHLLSFVRNTASSTISLYVDQSLRDVSTDVGNQSLDAFQQIAIGAQPGPYNFLTGDIAEIIVLDEVLDSSELSAYESAILGKYSLSGGSTPLVPTRVAANGARISWAETAGATSYTVLRSDSESGPFNPIATGMTSTSYLDTTASGGQTHYYRIEAENSAGTGSASAIVESILPELPENGRVLINEIHYNGLNNTVHSDFIELFNFDQSPVDISGWTLSGAIDFTFPAGTTMQAGGYLVIAQNPATVAALWNVSALGPYEKSLSSDGETITLTDTSEQTVAEVSYRSGFPWPCAANGDGASAELVNPLLDPNLGSSWRASIVPDGEATMEIASPGAQNYQFKINPAPNIEEVVHAPTQPTSNEAMVVTAKLSDADGIASATLSYQIVSPGNYIPAYLPLPIVDHQFNTNLPRTPNPAFEDPANWTNIPMWDDGTHGDAVPGDGIFTAVIPGQNNRTLVRYRVSATDLQNESARAPFDDDESKNFACYVYDGVPDYQGVSASTLQTLPVYQFLTRQQDYDQCVAYNSADQLSGNTPSWTYENWEGAFVFEGVVYDHIKYRLHGGNGRYYYTSKRGFRFFFNKGYDFQNRDNDGNLLPTKWNSMTTENCWENRGTLTYSLNEMINFHLWETIGIPSPRANWGHFRTVTTAQEQADAYHGDFWGLIMIHEDYDSNFLDSHELEKGNVYKLTRDETAGLEEQRYQAPDAVSDGSDHDNIYQNLNSSKDEAFIRRYVNVEKWSYYHALCQAVRHYDYWPTGDNNAAYYFEPDFTDQTDHLGKLWTMPNDVDATWGPTWNEGKDVVYAAIFDNPANSGLYPQYFNAVREVRDLLWQEDQIDPLLDEFAAKIAPFVPADSIRWKGAPSSAGNYDGLGGAGATSLENLVIDMKQFAWVGGSWPGGDVASGGRAAFMDQLQRGVDSSEANTIPNTPVITYTGPGDFVTSSLSFSSSAFSDPQGTGDFAAMQWRIAEVTNPTAPAYDPADQVKLEWNSDFDSGPIDTFNSSILIPATVCKSGHAYRARVRHQDQTGRWSHWSEPIQFIAGVAPAPGPIVVSEMLYKPSNPTLAEISAGFDDQELFEFMEIRNVGSESYDLTGAYFEKGITFTFPSGFILAPGESCVIVPNAHAFAFRYGPGRNIAGTYVGALKNSGERIQLLSAAGLPLVDFTYSDSAPWPTEADTDGRSLVLIHPDSQPDPSLPENWMASPYPGGTPGYQDQLSFETWASHQNLTGSSLDDDDGDGLVNLLEYAFNSDPASTNQGPDSGLQQLTVDGNVETYLTITFLRNIAATDLTYHVEFSTDLESWEDSPILIEQTNHYDGTMTETWRAPVPVGDTGFLHVRVVGETEISSK